MPFNAGSIRLQFIADISRATAQFREFNSRLSRVVKSSTQQLQRLSAGFSSLRLAAGVGLGLGILKFGGDADAVFTDIQESLRLTDIQFKELRQSIIDVANEKRKNAREAAEAYFFIVRSGATDAAGALNLLRIAADAASIAQTDSATTARVIVNTLNSFNLAASNAESVIGKIIRTTQLTNVEIETLVNSLGLISPIANELGVSLDELLAIMVTLTRNGLQFNQAARQTLAILQSTAGATGQYRRAIEDTLGTTFAASIANEGFAATLTKVIEGTSESEEGLFALTTSMRAVGGLSAFTGDNIEKLNANIRDITDSGDTFGDSLAVQDRRLGEIEGQIRALLRNRLVQFFENNRDAIVGIAIAVRNFVIQFSEAILVVVGLTAAFAAFAAAGLVLKFGLAGLLSAFGILQLITTGLTISTTALVTAATGLATTTIPRVVAATSAWILSNNLLQVSLIRLAIADFIARTQFLVGAVLSLVRTKGLWVAATNNARNAIVGLSAALTALNIRLAASVASGALFARIAGGLATAFAAIKVVVVGVVAPIAALLAVVGALGFAFFKLGQFINSLIPGLRGATKEQQALYKETKQLNEEIDRLQQVNLRSFLSRNQEEIANGQQLIEIYKELRKAVSDLVAGDEFARESISRLQDQIEELGGAELNIQALETRFAALGNMIAEVNRQRDLVAQSPLSVQGAFAVITDGDVEAAQQLANEYNTLRQTLGELKDVASDVETQLRNTANVRLGEIRKGLTQEIREIKELSEQRFAAGRGAFENQIIEFQTEIERLNRAQQDLQRSANDIGRVRIETGDESFGQEELESILALQTTVTTTLNEIGRQRLTIEQEQAQARVDANRSALEEIEQVEIKSLELAGKFREAEERAAELRHSRAIERIEEEAEVDQVTQQLLRRAADIAFGNELEQINRNERRRLESSEEFRNKEQQAEEERKRAALREEEAILRRQILQAQATNNAKLEVAARNELLQVLRNLNDESALQAEFEAQATQSVRERLDLLREELETAERLGESFGTGGIAEVIRNFLRDLIGSSDAQSTRGTVRRRFEDIDDVDTINEILDAVRRALEIEAADVQEQLRRAIQDGDTDAIERLERELRDIAERFRIVSEEARRATEQIERTNAASNSAQSQDPRERAREEVAPEGTTAIEEERRRRIERNLRDRGIIGEDEELIGRDADGNFVTATKEAIEEAIRNAARDGDSETSASDDGADANLNAARELTEQAREAITVTLPEKLAELLRRAISGTSGLVAPNGAADAVRDAGSSVGSATSSLSDATDSLASSIRNMTDLQVVGQTIVRDKLIAIADLVNEHAAKLNVLYRDVDVVNVMNRE